MSWSLLLAKYENVHSFFPVIPGLLFVMLLLINTGLVNWRLQCVGQVVWMEEL